MFEFRLPSVNQVLSYVIKIMGIITLGIVLIPSVLMAETLKLTTGEFPPYISSNSKQLGPLSQIVSLSFEKQGYQAKIDINPWNRALKMAEKGRVDATYAWSIKAERQTAFLYSKPLFIFEQRAFALSKAQLNVVTNLNPKSIKLCRPQGYALQGYSKHLIDNGIAIHFSPPDVATCFNMLKANRVDIVVVDKLEGYSYVTQVFESIDEVKVLDKVFFKYSNHLLVSKQHPKAEKLIQDFNLGLENLMATGEYQSILSNELGL
ncbi:hypothetical protein OA92_01330 [Marinomonas sp. SBI22]|uniref:substrate-binding periplasmic protein n=1 Tax=unclassified Marinomonas TaxID=196814 RepID=UPI0007AF9BC6|nr:MULTISPECIES: transporter substrate-binding domain-containing protein [unclassified Marinomonas]KZM45867.1 hypothetical protein OA92_01330 [Marinomonas sp. SBI22]KZM46385.1 hypothetical protein OA91_05475 [Marinomonas sp. SBI8L]